MEIYFAGCLLQEAFPLHEKPRVAAMADFPRFIRGRDLEADAPAIDREDTCTGTHPEAAGRSRNMPDLQSRPHTRQAGGRSAARSSAAARSMSAVIAGVA